jgi:hypothetical protein
MCMLNITMQRTQIVILQGKLSDRLSVGFGANATIFTPTPTQSNITDKVGYFCLSEDYTFQKTEHTTEYAPCAEWLNLNSATMQPCL